MGGALTVDSDSGVLAGTCSDTRLCIGYFASHGHPRLVRDKL